MSVRKFSQILPILLDKERGEIAGLTIFQNLKLTYHVTWHIVSVWIQRLLHFAYFVFCFFFFFIFFIVARISGDKFHCSWTIAIYKFDFSTLFITLVGPVHYSRDSQISLFSNFFIKNGFYGTIYTFKNYFAIVFSISVFNFSKNKLNPNGPYVLLVQVKVCDRNFPFIFLASK